MNDDTSVCLKVFVSLDEMREKLLNQNFYIENELQLNDTYMIEKEEKISLENFESILSDYLLIREYVGKRSSLVF